MQRSSLLPESFRAYSSQHAVAPPPISGPSLDPASERHFRFQRANSGVPGHFWTCVSGAILACWACPGETSKGSVGAWAGLRSGGVRGSPNGVLLGPSSLWTAVAGGLPVSCTAQSRGRHHHGHGCESALRWRLAGHLVARECCAQCSVRLAAVGVGLDWRALTARARWAGEGPARVWWGARGEGTSYGEARCRVVGGRCERKLVTGWEVCARESWVNDVCVPWCPECRLVRERKGNSEWKLVRVGGWPAWELGQGMEEEPMQGWCT